MSAARAAARRAQRNGGRPDRRMPHCSVIARYWAEREQREGTLAPWCGEYGWDWCEPACMACSIPVMDHDRETPSFASWNGTDWLQRCHIVARSADGLDGPQNLVLMCKPCHSASPDTNNPDELFAWMRERSARDRLIGTGYFTIEDGELIVTELGKTAIAEARVA